MALRQYSETAELVVDAAGVHPGMTVFARDNTVIGTITEVWVYTDGYGYVAKSQFVIDDYGPIRGTAHLLESATGYLQVSSQRGASRTTEFHIPLEAIQSSVPGTAVVVAEDAATLTSDFTERPPYTGRS